MAGNAKDSSFPCAARVPTLRSRRTTGAAGIRLESLMSTTPPRDLTKARLRVNLKSLCQYKCAFCWKGQEDQRKIKKIRLKDHDYAKELLLVKRVIYRCCHELKIKYLLLGDDEPTLYPGILEIIRFAKKTGYRVIHMQSNGLRFSDRKFARKMADAGLTDVELPLYGTAKTHDKIVRCNNSYKAVMRALNNLSACSVRVELHTLLLKQNQKEIPSLRSRFKDIAVRFPRPVSDSEGPLDYKKYCVRLSDIPPDIKETMDLNIPCVFGERKDLARRDPGTEIRFDPPYQLTLHTPAVGQKDKPAQCGACKFFDHCEGIYPLYLDVYGADEFRPIPRSGTRDKGPRRGGPGDER